VGSNGTSILARVGVTRYSVRRATLSEPMLAGREFEERDQRSDAKRIQDFFFPCSAERDC
jgi:hypothetical protein